MSASGLFLKEILKISKISGSILLQNTFFKNKNCISRTTGNKGRQTIRGVFSHQLVYLY